MTTREKIKAYREKAYSLQPGGWAERGKYMRRAIKLERGLRGRVERIFSPIWGE